MPTWLSREELQHHKVFFTKETVERVFKLKCKFGRNDFRHSFENLLPSFTPFYFVKDYDTAKNFSHVRALIYDGFLCTIAIAVVQYKFRRRQNTFRGNVFVGSFRITILQKSR